MADGSFVENVNQPPTEKEMEGNESQVEVAELSSPRGTEKSQAVEGENQKEDPQKQKEREEKLRLAKERKAEDRQRKMGELAEAEKRAEGFRKKQEEEKKKKLDEMRRKEREHRALVEERRRKLMDDENAKRNAILKKNASKENKGEDKKTKKSSGPYGFGSRAPRMVCSSIDNTKRAVSHGNLLNKQSPINSFDVLDASAPNGGQRIQRRAASACNLKSPRVAAKQGQDRPQTSSSYNRLSVSTSHLARTHPREHGRTATGHAGSLADLSNQGLGAAPGLRRPASSQSEHTLTSNDSSPRRRPRPHSVAGRVPGYASPTIASQIRQGRSQDKKSAEGNITVCYRFRSVSPAAKGRSKSADTGALRRSRADIRKTFDRLSTPKKAPPVKVAITPRESPKPQTTPKMPVMSRSYATPPKPAVPRSLPKESPKQTKASLPATSHRGVTPTKGPLKAVHMNLPLSNKKSRPPLAREESPMKEKKSPSVEPQPKSEPSKAEPPKAEPAKPPAAAAAVATAKPAPAATAKPAAAATTKPAAAAAPSPAANEKKPAPAANEKKQEVEDYKAKLAENRRQAREKAEREAEEERLKNEELKRQDEERKRKEEEDERKRIEEDLRVAAEARKAEEERLRLAIEAEEKRKQEEEERLEAEKKAKEEADRQALEDRERLEKERQERKKREEEERQERKKRLEMIMKRVKTDDTSPKEETPSPSRGTASSSGTNTPEEVVAEAVQEPSKEEKPNNVSTQPSTLGAQPYPVDDDAPKFKSPLLQQMLGNKRRAKPINENSADSKNDEVESDKENKDNEQVPTLDLDVSRSEEEPVQRAEDTVERSGGTEPAIGSEDVQIGIQSETVDNQSPQVAASEAILSAEQTRDIEQIVHREDKLDEQTHVETSATSELIDNHKEYIGDIRFDADKDVDTLEADTQPLSLSQTANSSADTSADTANILDLSQPVDGASELDKSREVDSNVINGFADNTRTDSADSFSKDSVLGKPVQPNGLEYEGAPEDNQFEQLIDLSTVDSKKGPLVATNEDSSSRNLMDSDADLLNSNSQSPLGAPLIAFEDNTTLKQENIPEMVSSS